MSSISSTPNSTEKGKVITGSENVVDIGHLNQVEHFSNGSFSEEDVEIISAHIDDYSLEEAKDIVNKALEYHKGDACLSHKYYLYLQTLAGGPLEDQQDDEWSAHLKFEAFLIHDWSIYPEIRSVTRPIEETEYENYENIRVYLISILWSSAGSVLATFFAVRFPSISLASVAIQVLIAYTGKCFERIPDFSFPIGFGRRCHFGGGKWNFKEQMLATVGMSTGNQSPYSQYVVLAMANDFFYGFKEAKGNFGFSLMLTLSTNLMGFGLSGIFRVFLVYPVRMLWYTLLPNLKLSRILVESEPAERENIHGWKLRGWEFFWLFSIVEFLWYWVTDFLFQFLGYFDWVAWISHENNNLLAICGVNGGLGVNPFPSFDWSLFMPTAMVTPFFSTVSMLFGMLLTGLIIIGMWWMNVSWTSYLPINSNSLYDNTGNSYNVSMVLDPNNNLDPEKYKNYSMPFWSAANLIAYGANFAFFPGIITYSILNYGDVLIYSMKSFWKTLKNPGKSLASFDDRFSRSQRRYKEVPEWWYMIFLVICVALGIATVEHWKFSNTPVWTIFFGIALSAIFMVPFGVLYATTNQSMEINVLFELIIGLTNEGNGSALMVSKAFATNFMSGTDNFVTNLKTGHYSGLAPRAMFRLQIINCIINSFVQSGLVVWQSSDGSIKDMCSLDNKSKFNCQDIRTYFNSAVQWGTIGPRRVLRDLYPGMRYAFLFGALFPLPFWVLRRFGLGSARKYGWGAFKEGGSKLRNSKIVRNILSFEWTTGFNEMVILYGGANNWAPYNFMYYLPWLYVGLVFQVLIPRYWTRWWQKYNYLLYAAITVGYSYSALIMFFATEYTHQASIDWWGNDDGIGLSPGPRLPVPESGTFGPASWS